MKVYISQPMRGRSKEEILALQATGKTAILAFFPDAEFFDNYFEDYDPNKSPVEYLSDTVRMMSEADMVAFLPGYYGCGNRGCEIEEHICMVYNIPRFVIDYRTEDESEDYIAERLIAEANGVSVPQVDARIEPLNL